MKQKMYSCDARVILSILIGLFLSCNVFAQDVTIKGNVKDAKGIIRKTKCFDFWERNVLFPKTKRSFFRTPTLPFSA